MIESITSKSGNFDFKIDDAYEFPMINRKFEAFLNESTLLYSIGHDFIELTYLLICEPVYNELQSYHEKARR